VPISSTFSPGFTSISLVMRATMAGPEMVTPQPMSRKVEA
jgi:hypothetical protein